MRGKHIIIFTSTFYDFDKNKIKIGGVETYIKDLARLCASLGFDIKVIQYSKENTEEVKITFEKITVVGLPIRSSVQVLFNNIRKDNPNTFIIIASDQLTIKDKNPRTLQIQHGIAFDIPVEFISGFWHKSKFLIHLNKLLRCIKNVRRFYQVPNTVCVDYNFFNWFRTLGIISSDNYVRVIPNYASKRIQQEELNRKLQTFTGVKKIIFARRFVDYRGTNLFIDVAEKLLKKYQNLSITFAGSGPLENKIRLKFKDNKRVDITSFTADESVSVHSKYDMAIVPTIFSEGTSLSLLEAMAAGCFTVATHVGGMTNIMIDGYNGLLSYPDTDSVYLSIVEAIEMDNERFKSIVRNGYDSIVSGFSINHWKEEWTKVLNDWTKSSK